MVRTIEGKLLQQRVTLQGTEDFSVQQIGIARRYDDRDERNNKLWVAIEPYAFLGAGGGLRTISRGQIRIQISDNAGRSAERIITLGTNAPQPSVYFSNHLNPGGPMNIPLFNGGLDIDNFSGQSIGSQEGIVPYLNNGERIDNRGFFHGRYSYHDVIIYTETGTEVWRPIKVDVDWRPGVE